jgi:hypothetical protein
MWWIVSWHQPNTKIVLELMLCLVVAVQGVFDDAFEEQMHDEYYTVGRDA